MINGWLTGDAKILTKEEKKKYQVFNEAKCQQDYYIVVGVVVDTAFLGVSFITWEQTNNHNF